MPYTNNIPQPTDNLSASQADILENFSQLDIQYGSSGDHVAFTAGTNNGKHKKATMVEQSPSPTAGDNEMVLYTAQNSTSNVADLYLGRESAGTVLQISDSVLLASQGNGRTVDGLIFKCGQGSTNVAVSFAIAFPNALLSAQATPFADSAQVNVTSPTASGFSVATTASTPVAFFWIAIGY